MPPKKAHNQQFKDWYIKNKNWFQYEESGAGDLGFRCSVWAQFPKGKMAPEVVLKSYTVAKAC